MYGCWLAACRLRRREVPSTVAGAEGAAAGVANRVVDGMCNTWEFCDTLGNLRGCANTVVTALKGTAAADDIAAGLDNAQSSVSHFVYDNLLNVGVPAATLGPLSTTMAAMAIVFSTCAMFMVLGKKCFLPMALYMIAPGAAKAAKPAQPPPSPPRDGGL